MTTEIEDKAALLKEDKALAVSWGIVFCVWCCPKAWSAERIGEEVTRKHPPGTSLNQWVVSEPRERKDDFNGVNQLPCPDDPNRVHWLLNC